MTEPPPLNCELIGAMRVPLSLWHVLVGAMRVPPPL